MTIPILLLMTLPLLWAAAWVAARALVVEVRIEHADALLVLAGAPEYFGRVAHAGCIFLEGRARKILLTNDRVRGSWSRTLQRNPFYYERAILRLMQAGVPERSIELIPGPISSTFDEVTLLCGYAQVHGVRSVIVVTSDYHTRRALWSVRRALQGTGIQIGIESVTPDGHLAGTWWGHTRGWEMVAGEYVKYVYYRLRYST